MGEFLEFQSVNKSYEVFLLNGQDGTETPLELLSFTEGSIVCQDNNSTVGTVNSQEEFDILEALGSQLPPSINSFWIGLNVPLSPKTSFEQFSWVDDTDVTDFIFSGTGVLPWGPGRPNGNNDLCAFWDRSFKSERGNSNDLNTAGDLSLFDNTWDDHQCSDSNLVSAVLCQQDIILQTEPPTPVQDPEEEPEEDPEEDPEQDPDEEPSDSSTASPSTTETTSNNDQSSPDELFIALGVIFCFMTFLLLFSLVKQGSKLRSLKRELTQNEKAILII